MFQKITIPPGVNRELTQYALEGAGWYDTDKVRFRAGLPEKIGGWVSFISDQLLGIPRSMHVWRTLEGLVIVAVATEEKVYIIRNNELIDITPVRKTTDTASNNPITTTNGSSVIKVYDPGHGVNVGDYVTLSGAYTFNGVDTSATNDEHAVTAVDDNQYYYVDCGDVANATGAGGGPNVVIAYQVGIGIVEDTYGYGWGACAWNTGTWNTPRECDSILIPGRIWSLDNWGEDLIMNPWGGAVYVWDASSPHSRGTLIPEAPSKSQFIKVTDDRHLACFGCNYSADSAQYAASNVDPDILDTLRIQWCSQEDYTEWDIGERLKTAGDYRLTGGSQIIAAAKVDTVILVWTEEAAHLMQAIDPPILFRFDQIGTSTGIIAPNAWAVHNGLVVWMGDAAFYTYQGGVSPLACSVEEYLFDGMNYERRRKVFAMLDRRHDEISWYYPTDEVEDTALIEAVESGDTTLNVETTAGYADSGTLTITGDSIPYTGKTDSSFTGCTTSEDYEVATIVSTSDTGSTEPSRYVTFGLKEQAWWIGRMDRTTGVDRGMIQYPIMANDDGYLFDHECGVDANGEAMTSYLESCDFDLEEGDRLMFVRRFVPDFDMEGSLEVRLRTRYFPQSAKIEEVIGTVEPTTEFISTRIRGREAAFTVKSTGVSDDWRLGACRLDVQPDGGKD